MGPIKSNEIQMKTCLIIVAHPDDETLWAGGAILSKPKWKWFIICLCRESDENRKARFINALLILNAQGVMGDLDDGPEQHPLSIQDVEQAIVNLLPHTLFDLVITHSPHGEYTRHLRHEETSIAVLKLLETGKIVTKDVWLFAYEDHFKTYYPKAIHEANITFNLTHEIWLKKYRIITEVYGFDPNSWEAKTTPKVEAFWKGENSLEVENWFTNKSKLAL